VKSYQDCDLYLVTWNVLSLYTVGTLKQVKNELEEYSITTAAIQEIRQKRNGVLDTRNFTMMYSGKVNNTSGTGFVVNRRYKQAIMNF
jgi:hypothetical protein